MVKTNLLLKGISRFIGWLGGFVKRQPRNDNTVEQDYGALSTLSSVAATNDHSTQQIREYPYIVIRIFPAVYQRESIRFIVGPEAANIATGRSFVQHPAPFLANGTISTDCRRLLIEGVETAVRNLKKFRMCVVWSPQSCTYVDVDRRSDSASPPSGGNQEVRHQFAPQRWQPSVQHPLSREDI